MLLSRVADNLYWGARYLERAQDTARVVRCYTELIIDLPRAIGNTWEPLLAVVGGRELFDATHQRTNESDIVRFLVADTDNFGSILSSVAHAREILRTTREVLPREAWQTVNDLYLYTASNGEAGVDRRSRARFLGRVIADSLQIDGVLTACMSRDEAYEIWRLGESLERADMTTRVVGVRAAALLSLPTDVDDHDEVQWMGVLRSLSALQMYQRATRGPIEGASVVQFLLFEQRFPRSVASCVTRMRQALERLPMHAITEPSLSKLEELLQSLRSLTADGAALDEAMDHVQAGLATVAEAITSAFMRRPL